MPCGIHREDRILACALAKRLVSPPLIPDLRASDDEITDIHMCIFFDELGAKPIDRFQNCL